MEGRGLLTFWAIFIKLLKFKTTYYENGKQALIGEKH
jgi:hypothetical protein